MGRDKQAKVSNQKVPNYMKEEMKAQAAKANAAPPAGKQDKGGKEKK
jgi:hypothetical protein